MLVKLGNKMYNKKDLITGLLNLHHAEPYGDFGKSLFALTL